MNLEQNTEAALAPCNCKEKTHEPKFIVLTGGPGAGKTAVLELVRKSFCEHVSILPESASILFGGGFWRKESVPGRKGAQRAIYHIQRELEQIVLEERKAAIALCDRGTIDGLAYWPAHETDFWQDVQSTKAEQMKRYEAVIHLRSPSLEKGYNHQNPVRIESAHQAKEIDEKLVALWKSHPKHHIIESTDDFMKKVEVAVQLIKSYLSPCCQSHEI